jgi:pyruvate kinase
VDAVAMHAKIAAAIEPQRPSKTAKELFQGVDLKGTLRPAHLIALGVEESLEYTLPAAVFVPTHSGATARRIAGFHLPVWIVALSSLEPTCQQLQFSAGVYPVRESKHPENWTPYVQKWIQDHGLEGKLALLTEGPSSKHPETNHRLEILDLRQGE